MEPLQGKSPIVNDTQYNIQIDKLFKVLGISNLIRETQVITGGLLHKMYGIQTDKGNYAVKALNPQIMRRPGVIQALINSELIATHLSNSIPALAAIRFNGNVLNCIDGQYYMVFDWVDGKSLKPDEIKPEHCKVMGTYLAKIHSTDYSGFGMADRPWVDTPETDWNYYLKKGLESDSAWSFSLNENIDNLCLWNKQSLEALKILHSDRVISHRDLDSKNVLWSRGKPVIIDWESVGYVNPLQELIEVLIYWSEDSEGNPVKDKFVSVLNGYKECSIIQKIDRKLILQSGYLSKLDWLEYNLKRSLGFECANTEEQVLGTTQVIETMKSLLNYARRVPVLEEWLEDS